MDSGASRTSKEKAGELLAVLESRELADAKSEYLSAIERRKLAQSRFTREETLFGKDISKLWPVSYEGQSDTACFDNALEFLVRGGYSLPHAAMMLIPERAESGVSVPMEPMASWPT